MHMPGILKVLGQVTLVAKQRNPVDWEIQSSSYANEGCAILLLSELSPDVERNIHQNWQLMEVGLESKDVVTLQNFINIYRNFINVSKTV
jgi:hypothetical protein